MRLTLLASLPLLARYAVQGACQTDPRVIQKINEARERLMTKPQNWKGKTQRFLFCASNACITLPREIETVEAATVCGSPMKMRSKWYDLLEGGPGSGSQCGGDAVIDRGDGYVTFADFDEPRTIKIYADVPEASGARLLLQGFDENGNRVRTWDDASAAWVDGEYVAINNETPAVSTTVFASLDGIQKPETNGFIRLYAFTAEQPSTPFSDTTAASVWLGENPAPGNIEWDGELVAASWGDPDESEDIIAQLTSNGTLVSGNFYSSSGVVLSIIVANSAFTPTELDWQVLGPVISGGAGTMGGTLWRYTPGANTSPLQVGDKVRNLGVIAEEFTVGYVLVTGSPGSEEYYFEIAGNTTAFTVGSSTVESYAPVVGNLNFLTFSSDPEIASGDFTVSGILPPAQWNGQFYTIRFQRTVIEAFEGSPDYLSLMSILHPDETHPSYRRYEVPRLRNGICAGNDSSPAQVIVMAKLRYLPVKRNTDFMVIEHIGALKHMLLAINEEEKGELAKALAHEAKAEEILAQELTNHIGDSATSNQPMIVQQECWAAGTIENIL